MLFSTEAVPFYIPTNYAQGFQFFHVFTNTCYFVFKIVCGFFDDGHSDWCEMISHCSFDLHFSND